MLPLGNTETPINICRFRFQPLNVYCFTRRIHNNTRLEVNASAKPPLDHAIKPPLREHNMRLLFLSSVLLMAGLLLPAKVRLSSWTSDCFLYETMGKNVCAGDLSGGLSGYNIPPLFPWLMGAVSRCGIEAGVAGIWISMIAFLTSIALIATISGKVHDGKWAILPCLAFALHPRFVEYAVLPLRTSVYIMLALSIFAVTLDSLRSRKVSFFRLCALGGAIAILRPEGIEVSLLSIGFIAWHFLKTKKGLRAILKQHAPRVAAILAVACCIAWFYHADCNADWGPTSYVSRAVQTFENLTAGPTTDSISKRAGGVVDVITEFVEAVYWPFFVISVIGVLSVARNRTAADEKFKYILFMVVACLVLRLGSAFLGVSIVRRHLCYPAALFLLFLPCGLTAIFHLFRKAGVRLQSGSRFFACCVLLIVVTTVPKTLKDRTHREARAPLGVEIRRQAVESNFFHASSRLVRKR